MTKSLGDFDTSTVVYGKFTTFRPSTGAAYTLAGTPALSVYKDNSTTQSTTGVTLTADFDAVTGLNHFAIDTSADGTFYSSGSFFDIVITTGTVDSVSVVGAVVGSFTLRKNSSLKPATAGRTLVVDASGLADANTVKLGPSGSGTAQTARDIGTSVLLSSGTGTGQISLSSGAVLLQATQTGVTIPTVTTVTNQLTAAQIATGVWQDTTAGDFTVASSIGKSLYTGNVAPGGANGLLIAGSNAATTFATLTSTGAFSINGTSNVAQTGDSYARIGANGASLTAVALTGTQTFNNTGTWTGNVTGSIGSLGATAKTDVNAEVVDALATDTYAEPGQGAPAATATLAAKINYLYKAWRNKKTQTSTTWSLYADDTTTVDQKSTVSDDGTTATRGEIATGP